MKKVVIFIDYESVYGMPFAADYDLNKSTERIMNLLAKYNAKATFNVCGQLAVTSPELIRKIFKAGHEIGVHGMKHEDMARYTTHQLEKVLKQSENAIKNATGSVPVGFRAPYMLAPYLYKKSLYQLLQKRGYKWASNRHVTVSNRIMPTIVPKYIRNLATPLFNPVMVFTDPLDRKNVSPAHNINWLINKRDVFQREKILEIPDNSSMDCSLLGLPIPSTTSDQSRLDWSLSVWKQQYDESNNVFCLNLHDWITGTSNRLLLLDNFLSFISKLNNSETVTANSLYNTL